MVRRGADPWAGGVLECIAFQRISLWECDVMRHKGDVPIVVIVEWYGRVKKA